VFSTVPSGYSIHYLGRDRRLPLENVPALPDFISDLICILLIASAEYYFNTQMIISSPSEKNMTVNEIDREKANAFADKMIDILNKGALALMCSIGHRTKLFDVMSDLPPSTSAQIATAADLSERYVREWLGAMVTGSIVKYNPDSGTYRLPPEHAVSLIRAAAPDNIAVWAQYIPLMGTVEGQIVDCFRNGGGVPYSAFGRFHKVMAEDSGQTVVAALLNSILPLVPGLVEDLKRGIDVLDVGCGGGRALNLMAKSFPMSRFTGYDISEEAISMGRAEAEQRGIANLRFEIKDVTVLDASLQYDLITAFDAIHDQAQPDKVLQGIATALHPDGTFLMMDIAASSQVDKNIDHPIGPLLYTLSCMHCMTVSLASNGAGLGAMWGEEMAREMLKEAGFTRIEVKKLPHDFWSIYYIIKKN
jgi:2-polyprenyl-3-methyl-5-hydroxy-6-metoxy-1,4-benzoquinol methylase